MTDPIRILFVDNQVDAREWLAGNLRRKYAFEVDCADDGQAALARVEAGECGYDVALVDVRLGPGPDGIEVMKSLQIAHPGVEVIIITGFGDVDDGVRAMQAGACNYVFKPWRDEELVVYIRYAAERRRRRNVERELDGLQKILSVSEAMTQSLDPQEIAREICARVVPMIPALKLFYIAAYDEYCDEARFLWAVNAERHFELPPRSLAAPTEWGLTGQVIKTRQAIIVSDLDSEEKLGTKRVTLVGLPSRACISLPLISRDKVIGVLSAQSQQPGVFTQEHVRLLQAITNQTAVAIDNAIQHQQTAHRLQTLSRFYETLGKLRTALKLNDVLNPVVDSILELFSLDTCSVGLFDKNMVKVRFHVTRGLKEEVVERELKKFPRDLWEQIFDSSNPIIIPNLTQRPDFGEFLARKDLKSFVILPLHGKKEPLGIVTMGSRSVITLSEEQNDLLRAMADQVAVGIENALLYEETEAWARQLDRFNQIARDIANEREIPGLLRTIANKSTELLKAAGSGVYLLTKDKQQFQLAAATGQISELEGEMFQADKGLIGRVLRGGRSFGVYEYWKWPERLEALDDKRQTAVMGAPIFSDLEIIGVLVVHDIFEGRIFSKADADLLSRLGSLVGSEIEKALLLQERDATSEMAQTLVSVLNFDQLLNTILENLRQRFGYGTCAVLLKDQMTNELYIERAIQYPENVVRTRRIKINENTMGVTAYVARTGQPRIVPDVDKESLYIRSAVGSRSEIAVPLVYRRKTFGVLNVESPKLNAFDERDLRILTQAAATISIAIKNAELFKREKKKTLALRRMNIVGKDIGSTLNLDQVLNRIAKFGQELLSAEVCAVFHAQRKGFLRVGANAGSPPDSFDSNIELEIKAGRGVGLTGHIAALGKLVNLHGEELRNHPAIQSYQFQHYMPSGHVHSLLAVPLKQRVGKAEEVIGLIKAENKIGQNGQVNPSLAFDNQDELILRILAGYAQTAIKNAGLFTLATDRLSAAKSAVISLAATSAWAHDAAQHTYTLGLDAENLLEYFDNLPDSDPRVREAAKRIGEKAAKIAALIPNAPPDLSQKEPVYLGKVLQEIYRAREAELREKQIELVNRLGELPPVLANKQALHEVCDNLIRNAVRFMAVGGRITFSGRTEGTQLIVEVADTGSGIKPEIRSDLFSRRVRGANPQGTGIGLLLTRSYLIAYDGDIMLLDSSLSGTTFSINLPLAEVAKLAEKEGLYAQAGNFAD